jgi:hypothetical protein
MKWNRFKFCTILLLVVNIAYSQNFEPTSGTLSKLNNTFHEEYNGLVSKTIEGFGQGNQPVMIFTGDTLILLDKGARSAFRIIPKEYHELKALDHLALGIFTLIKSWQEGHLSEQQEKRLTNHILEIDKVKEDIKLYGFSEKVTDNQLTILRISQTYLITTLKSRKVDWKKNNEYAREISKFLLVNVDEAAQLEISNLHAQVSKWRKTIDTSSFKNLYVVIGSSHQARYREITVQYFDKVLNENSSVTALTENRLVFAESVFDEKGCLSMLARHIIDQDIGLQFFGDKFRMQRDSLSDAAAKYIEPLFPKKQ